MRTIGDVIKDYRIEHSLSLRDFGVLSGLSHSYIDKLEKGVDPRSGQPVEPTLDVIEKIAYSMQIGLDVLLFEIGKIQTLGDGNLKQYEEMLERVSKSPSKDEKDLEKRIEKMKEQFMEQQQGLMLSGDPVSAEAMQSILDALEFGVKQAKVINKKYMPKNKK